MSGDLWGPMDWNPGWSKWEKFHAWWPRNTERGPQVGWLYRRERESFGPGGCRTDREYLTPLGLVELRLDEANEP